MVGTYVISSVSFSRTVLARRRRQQSFRMKPFALKRKPERSPAQQLSCFTSAATERASDTAAPPPPSQQLSHLLSEGASFAEAGEWQDALRRFSAAARMDPTSALAHEQRAQVLLELGETWEAICAAEEALRCDPAWGDACVTLGRCQRNHGEVRLALITLERALTLRCAAPHDVEEEAIEVEILLCETCWRSCMRGN